MPKHRKVPEVSEMRQLFSQLLIGRNGFDLLNKLLLVAAILLWVASRFLSGGWSNVFFYLFLLCAGVCIFRTISRNISRRREENRRVTEMVDRFRGRSETFSNRKEQWIEYKVFKCPSCGMKMRVPRGEGKIRVTCRQCGAVFDKKS